MNQLSKAKRALEQQLDEAKKSLEDESKVCRNKFKFYVSIDIPLYRKSKIFNNEHLLLKISNERLTL